VGVLNVRLARRNSNTLVGLPCVILNEQKLGPDSERESSSKDSILAAAEGAAGHGMLSGPPAQQSRFEGPITIKQITQACLDAYRI
jgi:hypothetical protein